MASLLEQVYNRMHLAVAVGQKASQTADVFYQHVPHRSGRRRASIPRRT